MCKRRDLRSDTRGGGSCGCQNRIEEFTSPPQFPARHPPPLSIRLIWTAAGGGPILLPNMKENYQVCLMAPEGYQGSLIFRELLFLLRGALTSLGHDCVIKANQLDPERTNIVIGYHLLQYGDYLSSYRYIPFQLEQLAAEGGWYSENARLILEGAADVWDYSRRNIGFLAEKGLAARLLPVGYHEDLEIVEHAPEPEKDIDILFYGSINERRKAILDPLGRIPRARVATLTGIYGKERDSYIARSRIVLNMHFYKTAILEQVRVSFLLNNACFVVSEESQDDPYDGVPLVQAPYDRLVEVCRRYLETPDEIERERLRSYQAFKERYRMSELMRAVLSGE
jgi:hypothetical protein